MEASHGPEAMRNHIYTEDHCQNSSSIAEYSNLLIKDDDIYLYLLVFCVEAISRGPVCGAGTIFRWHILKLGPTFITRADEAV